MGGPDYGIECNIIVTRETRLLWCWRCGLRGAFNRIFLDLLTGFGLDIRTRLGHILTGLGLDILTKRGQLGERRSCKRETSGKLLQSPNHGWRRSRKSKYDKSKSAGQPWMTEIKNKLNMTNQNQYTANQNQPANRGWRRYSRNACAQCTVPGFLHGNIAKVRRTFLFWQKRVREMTSSASEVTFANFSDELCVRHNFASRRRRLSRD